MILPALLPWKARVWSPRNGHTMQIIMKRHYPNDGGKTGNHTRRHTYPPLVQLPPYPQHLILPYHQIIHVPGPPWAKIRLYVAPATMGWSAATSPVSSSRVNVADETTSPSAFTVCARLNDSKLSKPPTCVRSKWQAERLPSCYMSRGIFADRQTDRQTDITDKRCLQEPTTLIQHKLRYQGLCVRQYLQKESRCQTLATYLRLVATVRFQGLGFRVT